MGFHLWAALGIVDVDDDDFVDALAIPRPREESLDEAAGQESGRTPHALQR
jgi:hypothetical protein